MDYMQPLQVIWDYLGMHQEPRKADVIVGFGNFNTDILLYRNRACLRHALFECFLNYSPTLTRQPRSSGRRPVWMPVMVSYSFWLSSPIWPPAMVITSSL